MPWFSVEAPELSPAQVASAALRLLDEARSRLCQDPKRVLLLPPDLTRMHSGAGLVAETIYNALAGSADVHVIPTLGQHVPHTKEENRKMFGSIPPEKIHVHDWLGGVTRVGSIPLERVKQSTGGLAGWEIPIDLNKKLMREEWDLVINIGHVVPHEVLGFANHNKNYFIGLGGKETICASHFAAALWGIENNLGNFITPLRDSYNWAEGEFLGALPDVYFQIVMKRNVRGKLVTCGVYVGDDLETYLEATRASARENITILDRPLKKVVAVMQADEFRSTWVANKAIYRTRMALADGGELVILAPGLERFGEQAAVDALIRRYGYRGTPYTLEQFRADKDLREYAHAAAHLIHGSSEGRFRIAYCPGKLSRQEIESVGYEFLPLSEALSRYNPQTLSEGFQTLPSGEEIYFIETPSAGLWSTQQRLDSRRPFLPSFR